MQREQNHKEKPAELNPGISRTGRVAQAAWWLVIRNAERIIYYLSKRVGSHETQAGGLTSPASTTQVVILAKEFCQGSKKGTLGRPEVSLSFIAFLSALSPAHLGFARLDEVPDGLSFTLVFLTLRRPIKDASPFDVGSRFPLMNSGMRKIHGSSLNVPIDGFQIFPYP